MTDTKTDVDIAQELSRIRQMLGALSGVLISNTEGMARVPEHHRRAQNIRGTSVYIDEIHVQLERIETAVAS